MNMKSKLKSLSDRQSQVFTELIAYGKGVTASELARDMHNVGFFMSADRNNVHPRLREMELEGLVEVIGKRQCSVTSKTVSVYRITGQVKEMIKNGGI